MFLSICRYIVVFAFPFQMFNLFVLGSGKSYTMMGSASSKGLIPKICDSLFERISDVCTFFLSDKGLLKVY